MEVLYAHFQFLQDQLYSPVLCDILDDFGYRHQAMAPSIRPLDDSQKVMGRAFTVLVTDVFEIPDHPYAKEIEAVDRLTPGDVMVVAGGRRSEVPCGESCSAPRQCREGREVRFSRDIAGTP
ncbi:hypothetical protein [Alicyclobacillus macrosporangiidus]|uniref:RraA family protein n=1 Tax=Alicyclobacillus macrosporangiidus TaxID=392015 RepID=UPI00068B6AB3